MARSIVGTVVSDKADKTIVLSVTVRKTHPIYKKQYSRSTKYIAHDENNEAKVGDKVEVVETRPISKRKKLTLTKIVEKAMLTEADLVENVTSKDDEKVAKATEKIAPVVKKAKKAVKATKADKAEGSEA
ncbi:MAG: small subunit ribosomal protein S17 [Candidatus Saccharimonadales bacterium]|jgi:small subunit ribosomal protein S17